MPVHVHTAVFVVFLNLTYIHISANSARFSYCRVYTGANYSNKFISGCLVKIFLAIYIFVCFCCSFRVPNGVLTNPLIV